MSNWTELNHVIDTAIAGQSIVGSVILVSRDGEPVYGRASGHFDREAGVPMREDAIFRLASFTKPLVAAVTLAMIERGLLTLDQPVSEIFDYFTPRAPDGSRPVITIAHLLTHTGGIGGGGPAFDRAGVAGGLADTDLSLDDNLRRLASVDLVHSPGAAWLYGKGLDVLGGVVAHVHGASLQDTLHHYITGPLAMADTGFVVTDPARLGPVYADNPNGAPTRMTGSTFVHGRGDSAGVTFSPDRVLNSRAFQSGGSGGVGTARDFMTFLETLRKGGRGILSPSTLAMATRNQIGTIPRLPGNAFCYLAGIVTNPALAETPQSAGTYEWGGIYGHRWFVDPVIKLSAVIMTNTANEGCSGAFPQHIRDALYANLAL